MKERILPLRPLVEAYHTCASEPGPTSHVKVCAQAGVDWLNPAFLDAADDRTLAEKLGAFYTAVHPIPFHPTAAAGRVRFVRYALNHLLRGHDPLPDRLARCATPGKVYTVPGLGLTFWVAVVKAIDPDRNPLWCPATEAGLSRLGLLPVLPDGIGPRFEAVQRGCRLVGEAAPDLTAWQLDEFLARVGGMTGRELPAEPLGASIWSWTPDPERIRDAVREIRVRTPLRKRIREAGEQTITPLATFQAAVKTGEHEAASAAFRSAFPDGRWEAALLHLDDAYSSALPLADRSRLWCEVATVLREQFRVHPLELSDVILAATQLGDEADGRDPAFGGFCADTFRVLTELASATSKQWMATRRDWYQFALREPLVELCDALAARYVRPVLDGEYGWDMESDAKPGRALTSICKNDFGRSGPYQPVQWVTFYRRSQAHRRADAQFFVRVAADGVRFGFHLGRSARDAGRQFRHNIQEHGEAIHAALAAGEVFDECRFWTGDDLAAELPVRTAADLRHWATHKTIGVGKHLAPDAPLLRRDELVGEILLTFDRLVPVFACAAEADPRPLLARRAGAPAGQPPFDRVAFTRETFLSDLWLDRVFGLLRLKKQLVLQGVPGTGKTHVARCLVRLLTHDRPDCTRLVQFHPAYSYEEFVEGIRVRSVEVNGRNEVTYPVEAGVLAAFAEQATRRPSEPHVLLIDELNRGNLPRVFGELLYLLEYRDQAITLPYSKRSFRLPDNLFVIATMNAADRSAVALDQALRRRFSFVDMAPDPALLARWLDQNPPADPDETFGPRVVRAFEELNRRLARDLGPDKQIGHSLFMIADLDAGKLAAVWEHHVRPLLLDYFGGREERLAGYNLGNLAADQPREKRQANAVGGGFTMTWKRWLKRTLGAVVLVLALRTVWLVGEREWHRSQGEKEYAAAVAETDRTDPDWRWDALNAKRIKPPAGKNAADLIPRINALTPKDWGNRLDLTDEGMSREHPPANTRFDPDLIGSAREELARAHPAVELARTLKVFPAGYRVIRLAPNPYGTLLEDTQATRGVSNLLRWDIVIAVEDGDTVRAATDLLAMLYASRSIGDEPFLISQLVRIATRSIAHGSLEWVLAQAALTEPQLAGLQSAWAVDAEEPLLLYGLRGKRVVIDETIGRMAIGTVSFMQGTTGAGRPSPEDSNSFDRFAWWLYRGRLPRERAFALRWLNDAIEVARRPVHEQPAAMATLPFFKRYADRDLLRPHLEDFAPPEPDENLIIFRLLIPGLAKIPRASWRSTAEARSTVVALACERFRLKHGRWPKELAELPAELLPGGVPLDPFDGKLLCYRRLDDGVVIYSIGPDGTDNEGTIARDRPGVPGTDIGFRMWNPEQRRKPAVQPGDGGAIPPPREVKP